jgi:hypothetical protein
MQNVKAHTENAETTVFYMDVYGDIYGAEEDAEITGIAGTVTVDSFFVGSYEEMMESAKQKWLDAQ